MSEKPISASGYGPGQSALVRSTCLYVATKLGDLMEDLVVVGGLVPSLLVPQASLPEGVEPHVGTMDLDLGLALALLDEQRYETLADRLRRAGFVPARNAQGNPTRQRWVHEGPAPVGLDFLIAPSRPDDRPGGLRHLDADFAAIIAPGLPLAFRDRVSVRLEGETLLHERTSRTIQVCGPGAFTVLKALAFENRGENKDAYDLYYVLRNYGTSHVESARAFGALLDSPEARQALAILRRDFLPPDGPGARRVATFLTGGPDIGIELDVSGMVGLFLYAAGLEAP